MTEKKEPITTLPPTATPPVAPPETTIPSVVPVKPSLSAHAPSSAKIDAIVEKHKEEKEVQKKELLELMGAALKEFNGEGNIPIDHEYWHARNEYRRLSQ